MKTVIRHALTLIALLPAIVLISACQTHTPQATHTPSSASDAEAFATKQQEYEQLLQEWKTLKPGLTRLLAIEDELNLLLGQLSKLSGALDTDKNSRVATTSYPVPSSMTAPLVITPLDTAPKIKMPEITTREITAPTITEPTITAPKNLLAMPTSVESDDVSIDEDKHTVSSDAHFALQVASIPEAHSLPKVWQKMLDKNPTLLANMEPNFQKTNVKNTDYYRLKIGGFSTKQEANGKCNDLKSAGFACIVVDYTASNFAELSTPALVSLTP